MRKAKPKLSKAMKEAGIRKIGERNFNGSYTCQIELRKADLQNTKANPRRYSKAHGGKLKRGWKTSCVRNPILRYTAGKLTSIEGRHTSYELLDTDPNIVMTCEVHFRISDAEAAHIFHDLTVNSKRIGTWDAHACALTAGMLHAVEIQDALDEYQLTTPNSAGYNSATSNVRGYDPLREAWQSKNGVLDKLLHIFVHCYTMEDDTEEPAKSTEFMRGLLDILSDEDYSKWQAFELAELLVRRTSFQVTEIASGYAADNGLRPNRGHFYQAFCDVLAIPVRRRRAA